MPDLFFVSEAELKSNDINLFQIPQYELAVPTGEYYRVACYVRNISGFRQLKTLNKNVTGFENDKVRVFGF